MALLDMQQPMYRSELCRIYELHDLLPQPAPPDAYFRYFSKSLAEVPQKLKQFRDIETDLRSLDASAWIFLKSELTPLLLTRDALRGWQPLFDKLNQAKAYRHLKKVGYRNIESVPPLQGQQTPDLRANNTSNRVLCEVKTINISEIEARRRYDGAAGNIHDRLEDGFFRKLASDLAQAKAQMVTHDAMATEKIAYLVINFDDALHEYADRYKIQIESNLQRASVSDLEVVLDIKPPFYAAMS